MHSACHDADAELCELACDLREMQRLATGPAGGQPIAACVGATMDIAIVPKYGGFEWIQQPGPRRKRVSR
jgi:hypothetical protein